MSESKKTLCLSVVGLPTLYTAKVWAKIVGVTIRKTRFIVLAANLSSGRMLW